MKIMYRLHDFGKSNIEDLAKKAHEAGFNGVQLVLNKAIIGETGEAGTLSLEKATYYKNELAKEDLEVGMLGAYFNPVHSDKSKVNANILKFKEHLKYASSFGSKYVGSETGSFNDDKWTYNPLNRTEEAYQEVKRIFSDLASYAKEVGSNVAVEGADGHCMYSPAQLKRLYDEINNGHVFITCDIYNWLNVETHMNHTKIFDECVKLFPNEIVIFHIKDYIVEDNKLKQVGLGQGLMNWNYMMPIIKEKYPNAFLIFEGVKPEDVPSSMVYIKNLLK